MKTIKTAIFFGCLLIASISQAQEIKMGPKLGLNVSNLHGDDAGNPDPKIGVHIGGFGKVDLSNKVFFQAELLYSTKGAKDDNGEVRLNYVDFPLLVGINAVENLSFHLGPQFSFRTKSELELAGITVDIKDQIKPFDLGLALGSEYMLDMGLGFGIRYALGLGTIIKDQDLLGATLSGEVMNGVMQFYACYSF